ncbi:MULTISPECIES: LysR family transcriptional regulator ArgP [unclassified Arthrobacter]|uniref:LysR family transcriptional regulator ArgP n=1 Tax=unclassified Arthrobacter TaxID=235627 RepID=UPI001E62B7A7|nr:MULTISPECIES: LysR family transcriptional regulator ArgP [unclassified Arthrobacter]MCC9146740.1 LysR family transcriptional regulator ArgP [Arthrobacter sp. zg-Y919]MDK1277971.1 LysR family transcriptional regulator ArgP [Arthrobacter sp. zg.Y919]WIB03436.1 LysR family transcriptional regulator ArgP [Arthrobacter sp. zg-Y919]
MNFEHLRALSAVVDEGTFEAAADRLHISPSAVSQRIKALESSVGQVVVRRGMPCTPTEAGAVLLRMARQVELLEGETRSALSGGMSPRTPTPVAVNADSLATWFVPVLADAAGWTDSTLNLHVEDQDHSAQLLRQGDVIGAVTADPAPVNGCRVEALGAMRYLPVSTPGLQQRFTRDDGVDWAAMPVVQFNAKDDLQRRFLQARGVGGHPPRHTIPSSEAFLAAVRAGLGWGMLPELQLGNDLKDGTLVLLDEHAYEDVLLYWQAWKLDSERLDRIRASVRRAGGQLR